MDCCWRHATHSWHALLSLEVALSDLYIIGDWSHLEVYGYNPRQHVSFLTVTDLCLRTCKSTKYWIFLLTMNFATKKSYYLHNIASFELLSCWYSDCGKYFSRHQYWTFSPELSTSKNLFFSFFLWNKYKVWSRANENNTILKYNLSYIVNNFQNSQHKNKIYQNLLQV